MSILRYYGNNSGFNSLLVKNSYCYSRVTVNSNSGTNSDEIK